MANRSKVETVDSRGYHESPGASDLRSLRSSRWLGRAPPVWAFFTPPDWNSLLSPYGSSPTGFALAASR
jgi:hypothetical protein